MYSDYFYYDEEDDEYFCPEDSDEDEDICKICTVPGVDQEWQRSGWAASPQSKERTAALMAFFIVLQALGAGTPAVRESAPLLGLENAAATLAQAYATVGFTNTCVNLAVALRPLSESSPQPRDVDVDDAIASGYVLQIAYNERMSNKLTRSAYADFRTLVARLRERESILQNIRSIFPACPVCETSPGYAENDIITMVLECNAEIVDRHIKKGRKAIVALRNAVTETVDPVLVSGDCSCERWVLPYSGCDPWTAFCHLHTHVTNWDDPFLTPGEKSGLRKNIVFAARAVARSTGDFLKALSQWTKSLSFSQTDLEAYVERLAEIADAIEVVLRFRAPSEVELVGDDFDLLGFPSAYKMYECRGKATLAATGMGRKSPRYRAAHARCTKALANRFDPIPGVPVHAEVKLLLFRSQRRPVRSPPAPLGHYIASARRPCLACASFFQAMQEQRRSSLGCEIRCGPSSGNVPQRWQFPEFRIIAGTGLEGDHEIAERVYKDMHRRFCAALAMAVP